MTAPVAPPPSRRELELALRGTANALAKAEARRANAERERDHAIRAAVQAGMSYGDVGDLVGLARQRVGQLVEPRKRSHNGNRKRPNREDAAK
jgi:hypothetical protein